MNPISKSPKNPLILFCELCDYTTVNKKDWNKHTDTSKHQNLLNPTQKTPNEYNCTCGKIYKHSSTLYAHKKSCNNLKPGLLPKNVVVDSSSNEIKLLTNLVLELVKSNTDLQKQMLEVCQKMQPINTNNTTINTDNSNKTFNLQVFLNEKCKDAMNLDDFANSIQLKLSDLIRVGEEGYIPGMSKVIIERLLEVELCKRPIHCSDEKREAIQVKIADKWGREAIDSVNLMNAVRIVEQKQFDMLTTFRETYPECVNSDSHHNDMLIKLFQNLSNSREPEFIKVMKKVAKSVVINKDNV